MPIAGDISSTVMGGQPIEALGRLKSAQTIDARLSWPLKARSVRQGLQSGVNRLATHDKRGEFCRMSETRMQSLLAPGFLKVGII